MTTYVLLPEGLAIHVGLQDNTSEGARTHSLEKLSMAGTQKAPSKYPSGSTHGMGSYTDLRISWMGNMWRIQSAHNGNSADKIETIEKLEMKCPP